MDYRIRDLQEKPYIVWNDNFIVDNGSTIGKLGANALRNYCKDRLVHVSTSVQTIKPGVYYVWDNTPSSITITFENESNAFGDGEFLFQEFYFQFTANSNGTTLVMPSSVKWLNGIAPIIEGGKSYQVSIVNNLGCWGKFF